MGGKGRHGGGTEMGGGEGPQRGGTSARRMHILAGSAKNPTVVAGRETTEWRRRKHEEPRKSGATGPESARAATGSPPGKRLGPQAPASWGSRRCPGDVQAQLFSGAVGREPEPTAHRGSRGQRWGRARKMTARRGDGACRGATEGKAGVGTEVEHETGRVAASLTASSVAAPPLLSKALCGTRPLPFRFPGRLPPIASDQSGIQVNMPSQDRSRCTLARLTTDFGLPTTRCIDLVEAGNLREQRRTRLQLIRPPVLGAHAPTTSPSVNLARHRYHLNLARNIFVLCAYLHTPPPSP